MATGRTVQPAFRELLCLLAAGVSTASMVELALIAHWHARTQSMAWVGAWGGLTAAWLVARTGNVLSGLWYPIVVMGTCFVLSLFLMKETRGNDL